MHVLEFIDSGKLNKRAFPKEVKFIKDLKCLKTMTYKLVKASEATQKDKFGIHLHVYPATGGVGFVTVETEEGHNQEFYDLDFHLYNTGR